MPIIRETSDLHSMAKLNYNLLKQHNVKISKKIRTQKQKSILIVDDSEDNLEIISMYLNSSGKKADVAHNGQEAISKMKEKIYDVVLMDIEMPQMNGFQVVKELRAQKLLTKIIALTAHDLPEDKLKTKAAGFVNHITKPIDFDYLIKTIEES